MTKVPIRQSTTHTSDTPSQLEASPEHLTEPAEFDLHNDINTIDPFYFLPDMRGWFSRKGANDHADDQANAGKMT